jgi:uncharacterized membrane protein
MEQTRELHVGDVVVYHNPVAKRFNAIVTAVWSKTCINVVIVSGDETKTDSYGRQIERVTSLMHKTVTTVHGNYWRFEDEEPNPIAVAAEK